MYKRYHISIAGQETRDIAVGFLSVLGIEGFEETDAALIASAKTGTFSEAEVEAYLSGQALDFTSELIENQNWNAIWEASFEPVVVEDFACVRAHFHAPIAGVEYDLLITPKMSFGTGHHATTYMMMLLMRGIGFRDKSVFDFGTGTGILAILAQKMGASSLSAIDIDDWCIDNTLENIALNHCTGITATQSTAPPKDAQFDVVLANINKNILLENMGAMAMALPANGTLLMSGLLVQDEADIVAAASQNGLLKTTAMTRNGWLALHFNKI